MLNASVCLGASECYSYLNLESHHACEKPNYFMDFGYKYCRIFEKQQNQFSDQGQMVLPVIRSCLIQQLEKEEQLTCSNAKSLALQHHYDCYTQSGFCHLSIFDKLRIYKVIRKELNNPEFHATMKRIKKACNF